MSRRPKTELKDERSEGEIPWDFEAFYDSWSHNRDVAIYLYLCLYYLQQNSDFI